VGVQGRPDVVALATRRGRLRGAISISPHRRDADRCFRRADARGKQSPERQYRHQNHAEWSEPTGASEHTGPPSPQSVKNAMTAMTMFTAIGMRAMVE